MSGDYRIYGNILNQNYTQIIINTLILLELNQNDVIFTSKRIHLLAQ